MNGAVCKALVLKKAGEARGLVHESTKTTDDSAVHETPSLLQTGVASAELAKPQPLQVMHAFCSSFRRALSRAMVRCVSERTCTYQTSARDWSAIRYVRAIGFASM